jgi:serine/threonine protein kinase
MGSVYRAVDENLGVEVAVKENHFTTDEYARQFRLEAVILANLRHPNLPRVTDHFVIGDQGQYLVMDYIEGEDLRQRMERQGTITEEEAIVIGAAMCDALSYLHTRKPPILHRDVKPGNVKITPEGQVYLVDFGLAKVLKGSQATTTGARAMTPGYSPPEQYGTARTDSRTDIYSLSATLYAALTGIIPEDGLARAMDSMELTPIRKRNPTISSQLANVIERAMATKADDRFQTAGEFKQALLSSHIKTKVLEGEYVLTPPPKPGNTGYAKRTAEKPATPRSANASRSPVKQSKKESNSRLWIFTSAFFLLLTLCLLCVLGGLIVSISQPDFIDTILGRSESQTPATASPTTDASFLGVKSTPTETFTTVAPIGTPSLTPTRRVNPPTPTKTSQPTDPPPPPPLPTNTPKPTATNTPLPTPTYTFTPPVIGP